MNQPPPRIKKIYIEDQFIYTLFFNKIIKKYNIALLTENKIFEKLKNDSFLKTAKIDSGGYGISWNDDLDLSENELWTNGELIEEVEIKKMELVFG